MRKKKNLTKAQIKRAVKEVVSKRKEPEKIALKKQNDLPHIYSKKIQVFIEKQFKIFQKKAAKLEKLKGK